MNLAVVVLFFLGLLQLFVLAGYPYVLQGGVGLAAVLELQGSAHDVAAQPGALEV